MSPVTRSRGGVGAAEITDDSVTLADLNTAVKADWEYAYSSYKQLRFHAARVGAGNTAATYVMPFNALALQFFSSGSSGEETFYFDPANWGAGSRTKKLRISASCITNATAPAITFTIGLYPVTANGGGSAVILTTAGTVVSGSTVPFATPALTTITQANSGDFTAPAAGQYAIGVVLDGTTAASSTTALNATLEMRQV